MHYPVSIAHVVPIFEVPLIDQMFVEKVPDLEFLICAVNGDGTCTRQ